MKIKLLSAAFPMLVCAVACVPAFADHGSHTYTTGALTYGTAPGQNIALTGASLTGTKASLTFSCPIKTYGAGAYAINWTCAGGSVSIASADHSLSLSGQFTSASMSYSGSGGGRGGHTTYYTVFSGEIVGVVVAGGVSQAFVGSIYQVLAKPGTFSGEIGRNSAYAPVVLGDGANFRLIGEDNLLGTNQVSYGSFGSGVGQFQSITGLAEDRLKRIYVSDAALGRIDRIDDLTGKNWTTLGAPGAGVKEFLNPQKVTIDSAGKIWVADAGNNRLVRMDDMTGANWTTYGTLGTGTGQFMAPAEVAFDKLGRIYVADTGNSRIVRMDDLTGKNWVTLSGVNIDPYGYPFTSVAAVAIDPAGEIIVETGGGYLIRIADMTGASPSVGYWGGALDALSVDGSGTLYVAGMFGNGYGQALDVTGTGYVDASAPVQVSAIVALASSSPAPASAVLMTGPRQFGSSNVGVATKAQTFAMVNEGVQAMTISSIAAGKDFVVTDTCPATLAGGSNCKISVEFKPGKTGALSETLAVVTSGAHPSLAVPLAGTGTAPDPVLFPTSLSFGSQHTGTASAPQQVTLSNTGTGPLKLASVLASTGYGQTNNCPVVLVPGAACTFEVTFKPTTGGTDAGTLTIADDAVASGTAQVVPLTGLGTTGTPAYTVSPGSLLFPEQQLNVASISQTVVLSNTSAGALTLSSPVLSSGYSAKTNCPASLASKATCTYSVVFTPIAVGASTGTLGVNVAGQPAIALALSGSGAPSGTKPALLVGPNPVSFTDVSIGDSTSAMLEIANVSGIPRGLRSVSYSGPNVFAISGGPCPSILTGMSYCLLTVTFTPIDPNQTVSTGTLTVTESTGAQTVVPISGVLAPPN